MFISTNTWPPSCGCQEAVWRPTRTAVPEPTSSVPRLEWRRVLKGVGAGVATAAVAGEAAAGSNDEYVVGFQPGASTAVAKREAKSVRHELDFGHVGKAVSGKFPQQAIDALENDPNVRYVEQNGTAVDSASYAVSGSSASDSTRLQDEKGSGSYDIRLTVTDAAGNTTSQTRTVTA